MAQLNTETDSFPQMAQIDAEINLRKSARSAGDFFPQIAQIDAEKESA